MKKLMCMFLALLLCVSLMAARAQTVSAADEPTTPSTTEPTPTPTDTGTEDGTNEQTAAGTPATVEEANPIDRLY